MADQLLMSIRNVKLLFDMFSCCFKLEREYDKLQRYKVKDKMFMFKEQYLSVCKSMQRRVENMFADKVPSSQFIPRNMIFVSLEELHKMILEREY